MNKTCDICNHSFENNVYSSVGGQKVCSIKCASSVTPNSKDECSNCGSVVWEDENYNVNGELCCSKSCREALRSKNSKYSSSKKNITQDLKSQVKRINMVIILNQKIEILKLILECK